MVGKGAISAVHNDQTSEGLSIYPGSNLTIQRLPINPQHTSRFGHIAAGLLQGLLDQHDFRLFEIQGYTRNRLLLRFF